MFRDTAVAATPTSAGIVYTVHKDPPRGGSLSVMKMGDIAMLFLNQLRTLPKPYFTVQRVPSTSEPRCSAGRVF